MQYISGEDSSCDEQIVKLKCDPLDQSDDQGQRGSEGPGPKGEGEQAGQEHGAAPADRLAPAPPRIGEARLGEAFADQSPERISQEHGIYDFCKNTIQTFRHISPEKQPRGVWVKKNVETMRR